MSVEELQETLAEGSRLAVESLEKFLVDGAESNLRLLDTIQDVSSPDPAMVYAEEELLRDLTRALKKLGERDYLILSLYYFEELTLKEIGKVLEVSESRVCQLHAGPFSGYGESWRS
jgi:RNA polymerase sigma factor for flagellar operon FliA